MSTPPQAPFQNSPQTNSSNGFQPPANLGKIKSMMQMMQNGGNPQAMVQSMLMNDPRYGEIMKLVNAHGGDAKAAFYDLAKQKGVDPNEIIRMLQ